MKRCIAKFFFAVCAGFSVAQAVSGELSLAPVAPYWLPLAKDELHDPLNPALNLLQNPASALSALPREWSGDQVNWVKALDDGAIKPRINLHSNVQPEVLDLDVLLKNTEEMAMVNFPHKQHTEWLVCNNCHEEIFKSSAGANKMTMLDILNGEYCGRCHGAVAFPLTDCNRCHNVVQAKAPISARAH